VVRFLPGFEPVVTGWLDDRCPACLAEQSRERAWRMTRDEQRETIFDALRRDPTATVQDLIRRTGCAETFVRGVRRQAVSRGIARPIAAPLASAKPKAKRPKPETRPRPRPRPQPRPRPDLRAAVKAAVAANPGATVMELAASVGISTSGVRRKLHALIEAGEVEAARDGKGPNPVTYRIAAPG